MRFEPVDEADADGTYLTPREAAELAHCDRHTIYRWFREGRLTRYKTGATRPGHRGRTFAKLSELQGLIVPRACKDSATHTLTGPDQGRRKSDDNDQSH